MKITVRKAKTGDIPDIYKILNYYADREEILERTIDDITESLDKFFVALYGKEIIGAVSYYDYGINLKEIRSLAVRNDYKLHGVGVALINKIVKNLRDLFPEARIFLLSYHPEFFKKSGFIEISRDMLPEKIWKDCKNCKHRENCTETALVYSIQLG